MSCFMMMCCICGVRENEMASRPAMFRTFTKAPFSRSLATRSKRSLATASLIATWPCSSDWLGLALAFRRSSAAPAWPYLAARCNGVVFVRSSTLGLALFSRRSCTTEAKPLWQAAWRGVRSVPSRTVVFTSASFLKRYLQTSRWPAFAAPTKGVIPISGSAKFTSAFAMINSAAMLRLPASQRRTRHLDARAMPSKPSTLVKSCVTSKLFSSSWTSPRRGLGLNFAAGPAIAAIGFVSAQALLTSCNIAMNFPRRPSTKEFAARRASCDACCKAPSPPSSNFRNTAAKFSTVFWSATLV
mmetsp:Transcript_72360/g.146778  ORF Transcript_72360/g.146778 Transcript_72360/m.146778 type:complete len:300 (-) Transcript_72360:278-1177(-)